MFCRPSYTYIRLNPSCFCPNEARKPALSAFTKYHYKMITPADLYPIAQHEIMKARPQEAHPDPRPHRKRIPRQPWLSWPLLRLAFEHLRMQRQKGQQCIGPLRCDTETQSIHEDIHYEVTDRLTQFDVLQWKILKREARTLGPHLRWQKPSPLRVDRAQTRAR